MQKFKRTGDAVDVPALGLVDVTPNTHVEVHDPAVAESMHQQDGWEHLPDPDRSKAAKKAAAKREEG